MEVGTFLTLFVSHGGGAFIPGLLLSSVLSNQVLCHTQPGSRQPARLTFVESKAPADELIFRDGMNTNMRCVAGGRTAPLHGQHAGAAGRDGGAAPAAGSARLDRRQHPLLPVGRQPVTACQASLSRQGEAFL